MIMFITSVIIGMIASAIYGYIISSKPNNNKP